MSFTNWTYERSKFTPTSKSNPCPVCSDDSGKCRHTEGDLVLCMNGSGGVLADSEWHYLGDTKDGLWGKYVSRNDHDRREFPKPDRGFVPKQKNLPKEVGVRERDRRWREYLGELTLNDTDRAELYRRGFTDETIDRYNLRSGQHGFIVPTYHYTGAITNSQVRLRDCSDGGRYRWAGHLVGVPNQLEGELPISVYGLDLWNQRNNKQEKSFYTDGTSSSVNTEIDATLLNCDSSQQRLLLGCVESCATNFPSVNLCFSQRQLRKHPLNNCVNLESKLYSCPNLNLSPNIKWSTSPNFPSKELVSEALLLWMTEGFPKALLTSQNLGVTAIGFGSIAQLTSSRTHIYKTLKALNAKGFVFAPDAGCFNNEMVMRQSRSFLKDAQNRGFTVVIANWGQCHDKNQPDIDELPEGAEVQLITVSEFLRLAGDDVAEVYPKADRREYWNKAIGDGFKYILDTSVPGDGKSYDAGREEKGIYITTDPRNVTTPTLKGWSYPEARHEGLTDRDGKIRRARGDELMTPSNCSRVTAHHAARSRGIDGESICMTCPLLNACRNAEGDGYGFRYQRKEALINDRLVMHPSALPDPREYDYSNKRLYLDETMPFTEEVTADRDDVTNLIVELGDRIPQLTEWLKQIRELFTDRSERWGRGIDKLPPLPELTEEQKTIVKELVTPDFTVLQTEDTIDDSEFAKVRGRAKHELAQVNRLLKQETRQSSKEVTRLIESMPSQWLLWLIDGAVPHLHQGLLILTRRNDRLLQVIRSAAANIFLDATMSPDRLSLLLGVDKSEIHNCKSVTPLSPNLKVKQVSDMGRMGMQRGADQERRKDALIKHYRSIGGKVAVIDFKKFKEDGAWWRDSRGSNDFQDCDTLILVGTPSANVEAVRSVFLALGGKPENFQAYYDSLIQTEIEQGIGRIRANRRPNQELEVLLITDFDVQYPGIEVVQSADISPEAAPKADRTIDRCAQAAKTLIDQGVKVTQTAVAKIVGLAREYVNRIWESVTFCLEDSISKMSHSPPPMVSPDDAPLIAEMVKTVLNDNEATFNDIAEVFSWIDRKLWDKIREFLPDRDIEKLFALSPG